MSAPSTPIEVFYSYAHEDEPHLQELHTHLSMLKREGYISTWHDRQIVPGADWAQTIDTHLEQATVILLLISPDFLASDYCHDVEMQRALQRHEAGVARVIPIVVRPCDWTRAPFARLQCLPYDGKAIMLWDNQDLGWNDVAIGIRQIIEGLPLSSTWSLSFEKVQKSNPIAADLLRLCAFLHPDAIPLKLITRGAAHLGPLLAPVAKDEIALDEAIATLGTYSLIQRNVQEETLSIHRLVQAVLRDAMPAEEQMTWVQRAVTIVNVTFPDPDETARWSDCERCLPHVLECKKLFAELQMFFPHASELFLKAGTYLYKRAEYAEAMPLYLYCQRMFEQKQWPERLDLVPLFSGLANLYSELGKYGEAGEWCQKCLDIRMLRLGPKHPDVARSFNNLAILRKVRGKYREAEQLYRRSLRIWKQSRGLEHPDVAQSLNNLGVLYAEWGKYAQAEALFEESLRIWQRSRGLEHPDVAHTLSNLAILYTEQGRYAQAEELFEESLRIFKQSRAAGHSDYAYPLNGRAILFKVQGKYENLEKWYKDCQHIWERSLGPMHPQVAYALNNLAILYTEQGKYGKAEPLYERSLTIFADSLGPKHPHTLICARNYAELHFLKEDEGKAQELLKRFALNNALYI